MSSNSLLLIFFLFYSPARGERNVFESHEEALAFDVSKADIHAARVAEFPIPIENHVIELGENTVDEASGEGIDPSAVELQKGEATRGRKCGESLLERFSVKVKQNFLLRISPLTEAE